MYEQGLLECWLWIPVSDSTIWRGAHEAGYIHNCRNLSIGCLSTTVQHCKPRRSAVLQNHITTEPNVLSLKSGCDLSQSTLLNYGTHSAAEAKSKIISTSRLKKSWKKWSPRATMMWIGSVAQGLTKRQTSRSQILLVGKGIFVYAHLLITFFRCLLEVAVTDRILKQTHLRSGPEQPFLCYVFHKDLGGILAKMGLWL